MYSNFMHTLFNKGLCSNETTLLSLGPTREIIRAPATHQKVQPYWHALSGLFRVGWINYDLLWSFNSLRLPCINARAWFMAWIMHTVRVTAFRETCMFCSDFVSQNFTAKCALKCWVDEIRPSLSKSMHSLSFYTQTVVKSKGQV